MKSYAASTTLYVSGKTGNDWNTGLSPTPDVSGNGPLQTLAQAFSMIGQFRLDGLMQPYTVKLLDDLTELSSSVKVAPREDARYCEKSPTLVTVEPYGDTPVTVAGGKRITGWKKDTFNGHACLSAEVPEVKEGKWNFSDLYVDGDKADFTRFPAEGYLNPEDVENHAPGLFASSGWFIAKEGDIPGFSNMEDAFISFGHYWIDEHSKVASYDPATRKVTLESATRFTVAPEAGPSARMDYYIENVGETFSNPNEWYLDRKAGKVYYLPRNPEQNPEALVAYAPCTPKLLEICGTPEDPVDTVRFRRLRFTCTKGEYKSLGYPKSHGDEKSGGSGFYAYEEGKAYASDLQACSDMHAAIEFRHAKNCVLEDCEIVGVGNYGVLIGEGCHGVRLERCHLHCLGGGGVRINGVRPEENASDICSGNVVTNCHIQDGGRRYFAACGVTIMHSDDNEISHCSIHDFFYSGISCGWVWGYHASAAHHNRLLYNHIYNLGKGRLSDMGGIYMLGPQKGSVLRGNVIHDIKSKTYGGWALYTDEGSSYMTVEDNICYRCSDNCYHQHYGEMNVLRNNIFAFSGQELVRIGRREAHMGLLLENNIFYSDRTAAYSNVTPAIFQSDRNLFWNTGNAACPAIRQGEQDLPLTDIVAAYGWDTHSIAADPLFTDPENGDFTLREDSPALQIGFHPLDPKMAGCNF